jgi:hypothetical protein
MNKIARSNRGKNVLSVQLAHERAWQRRGGLNENAFKRLGLEQSASNKITRAARSRECTASRQSGESHAPDSGIARSTRPSAV